MSRKVYFISHPNVRIDPLIPVTDWSLSELGRRRMELGLSQPWVPSISSIYASTERKAIEAAEILAFHLSLPFKTVPELGENDRSSTGFLVPQEFERVATQFFENPGASVLGWERAADAQSRITLAIQAVAREDRTTGSIAVVSHGAVGTLLYCALSGKPVSRAWDQPANGGGNYFSLDAQSGEVHSWWCPLEACAA